MIEGPREFDTQAATFDAEVGLPDDVAREVAREVYARLPRRSPSVLELGAGTGQIGSALSVLGEGYVGLDHSVGMLRRFRKRCPKARVVLAELEGPLPLADQSFDIVFGSRILHRIPWNHLHREVSRVLKPGGILLEGRIKREPDDPLEGLRRAMHETLQAHGKRPRGRGAAANTQTGPIVASYCVSTSLRAQLERWARKDTLAGVALAKAERDAVLLATEAWAAGAGHDLHAAIESQRHYVLDAVEIQP